MAIIKANEPLPEGPVVIGIYGEPGVCKTTLANTAELPLLCDFDRGSRRSLFRKDTLVLTSWADVVAEETKGSFKDYKTIIIDTAKAALDDFLMSYVIQNNFKLKTNKLQAYGAIGDEFKLFLNSRRNEGADVIIIAHAKKDEDTKKQIPDVTGQSYQLMLRVCDQVGYVSMINNKRTIQFDPTDVTVGKNTAGLPLTEIPDKSDPAVRTVMQNIITLTRAAMAKESEEQTMAVAKSEEYQKNIIETKTPDALTKLLNDVHTLPDYLKIPLQKLIGAKAKEMGWIANKETKQFEAPAGAAATTKTPVANTPPPAADKPSDNSTDFIATTSFDDRAKMFANIGMAAELDGFAGFGITYTNDQIADMSEDQFNDAVVAVNEVKKKPKPKATKRNAAVA